MPERVAPKVDRLIETAINVDDLDVAVEFYSRVFGFLTLHRDGASRHPTPAPQWFCCSSNEAPA